MKVILLKDIPKVGKKDDVKEISKGHAINFLIPRKLVRPATDADVKALERKIKEQGVHKQISEELIYEVIKSLDGKTVEITEKANEQGHLFSKVHKKEIVDAVKESTGSTIEDHWFVLHDEIKEVGERELTIKEGKFKATITILVKAA